MATAPTKSIRPKAKPSKMAPKSSPRPWTRTDANNQAMLNSEKDGMKSGGKVKGKK